MTCSNRPVGSGGGGRGGPCPPIISRDDVMKLQLFHGWNEGGKVLGFLLLYHNFRHIYLMLLM